MGEGFILRYSSMNPEPCESCSKEKLPCRVNSKKQRVVASTSAVALCASENVSLNKKSCNWNKVGSLNFP